MKVFNIPGWKNADENHWQSIWENSFPEAFTRIEQNDWLKPRKNEWVERIGQTLEGLSDYQVTCHSIGCMAFIHAIKEFRLTPSSALLVAPSDPEQPNYPKDIIGFAPIPLFKLNFPSIVVASTNDQAVSIDRARFFAQSWGSTLITLNKAGHIEPKSGFGKWPEGIALLNKLN